MDEYLPFVTIDMWTTIFSWANLLILFLLLKHFLFKPINKILSERANEIENAYKSADSTKADAQKLRLEYENKLKIAQSEADGILTNAVENANTRSKNIVNNALNEAQNILEKSKKEIEFEKKSALNEAQNDISSMAVNIAEKLIEKKLSEDDNDSLIAKIIEEL